MPYNEMTRLGNRLRRLEGIPVDIELVDQAAMEAESNNTYDPKNLGINVDDTPMRIGFYTDKVFEVYKVKPVTNAIMFSKGNVPTPDGLFSYEIFGTTPTERRNTVAYIDLKRKFFSPYMYECLCEIVTNAKKIAAGIGTWAIVDGKVVATKVGDDNYDENATGIRWLINHFYDLKFEKNKSYIHNQYVDLLTRSTEDEIFISKMMVIPVFYRDANFTGHNRDIPEINDRYKRLIQLVGALRDSNLANYANNTEFNIQTTLKDIRKYGQSLIAGKRGFLKQFVIGKTTAYAARNVITQPVFTDVQLPSDVMVDIMHSGFPIATCCSMAYPFIEHWILDFFAKEFETRERKQILVKDKNGKYHLEFAKIGDVMAYYNPSYIEKKTEQYMHTYGSRFEPLKIPMDDGSEAYMLFTGTPYSKDPRNPNVPAIGRRAMTWTDLLYMACVNTLEFGGKLAYITRYPLVDYFGTFPSMIRVTSTIQHEPMEINGVKYPFYPKVVINATYDQVSTMFVDTVTMDNTYLQGLGGDYDGDTTSEKACFTEEANEEAFQILTDVKHFVSIGGQLVRMIGNEAYLTFYNMTKD